MMSSCTSNSRGLCAPLWLAQAALQARSGAFELDVQRAAVDRERGFLDDFR